MVLGCCTPHQGSSLRPGHRSQQPAHLPRPVPLFRRARLARWGWGWCTRLSGLVAWSTRWAPQHGMGRFASALPKPGISDVKKKKSPFRTRNNGEDSRGRVGSMIARGLRSVLGGGGAPRLPEQERSCLGISHGVRDFRGQGPPPTGTNSVIPPSLEPRGPAPPPGSPPAFRAPPLRPGLPQTRCRRALSPQPSSAPRNQAARVLREFIASLWPVAEVTGL